MCSSDLVQHWEVKRGRVIVATDKGRYTASRLVITAGAWASKLIAALRKPKLAVPERQVLIWTQPKRPELFQMGAFPVFILEGVERDLYYGMPVYGLPGFKLGKYHHRKQNVDPDRMDRECHPEDEAVLRSALHRYFPEANGPPDRKSTRLNSSR